MRILPPAPVAVNQAIITLGSSTSTQVPSSPAENRPGQPQNDPNGAKDDAASPVEVHGAVSEARPQASAPARDSKPALHAGEASALRPTETVKEPASPAISSGISSQNEQDGQERGGGKMSPDVGVSRDIAGMPEPPQPASPASLPQKTRSAGGRATSKVSASSRTPQATPNATELNRAPSTQAESENPIEQQRASAATTKQPPAEGRTLSFSVDKAIAPQQPRGPVISTGFKSTSTMKAGSPVIATVSPLRTQDSPKSSPSEAPRTRLSNASEH
ncbi:hypothetical protein OBBRIDRAFT_633137 [Obba rivulosa]|uniref:Uncharacterized protein n=1 Tax=Obba rivulosa TaxID=1052685 RepID=A0A8E2AXD2_9APHY|nr:hypothetical protein OBBRIDRAFT_633137 [Obba rivulosa]